MNKTVVYTVLTNGYDTLQPIRNEPGIDYICFTDDHELSVKGWTMRIVEQGDVKKQREIKILPSKYLPEYSVWVYMDANMRVVTNITQYLNIFRGNMLCVKHPTRSCTYIEAVQVVKQKKAYFADVEDQVIHCRKSKLPERGGMWATGFIIRGNNEKVNKVCSDWWRLVEKYTHRDQLALPLALYQNQVRPQDIFWSNFTRAVKIEKHKPKGTPEVQVYYSTPYSTKKDIGKANNDFIRVLPDDAWVCITDGDAMWLLPEWGLHVEQVIKEHGDDYGLIGCVTNRLGGLHQCYDGKFSEDMNVRNHYHIARKLWDENGSNVEPTTGVAGVLMLFKKETWRRAGGFKEGTHTTDTLFNSSVRGLGLKIGIATGLYMFHAYRIWEDNHTAARRSIKHLL